MPAKSVVQTFPSLKGEEGIMKVEANIVSQCLYSGERKCLCQSICIDFCADFSCCLFASASLCIMLHLSVTVRGLLF